MGQVDVTVAAGVTVLLLVRPVRGRGVSAPRAGGVRVAVQGAPVRGRAVSERALVLRVAARVQAMNDGVDVRESRGGVLVLVLLLLLLVLLVVLVESRMSVAEF